jgi:hypothetical protein
VNVQFISSFAVILSDPGEGRRLFLETLGLPLKPHEGTEYLFSEAIEGCKHFGVWPLREAAQACFGTDRWPADRPVPQACIEFEVADAASVATAAADLQAQGYSLLHGAKTEPWGQIVARTMTSDGLMVGISYAPWLHQS